MSAEINPQVNPNKIWTFSDTVVPQVFVELRQLQIGRLGCYMT